MKSQTKPTLILRRRGRLYKVITTRHLRGSWWTFECEDLETGQSHVFKHQMLGLPEAMDAAASTLKDPKDILLIDLGNKGKWRITTRDQADKLKNQHRLNSSR